MSSTRTPVRFPAIALFALLTACTGSPPADPPRPALVVQAGGVGVSGEIYSGEVRAREEPQLAFRVAGKVVRRLVDAGARVKAGQVLAELDSTDLRLQSEAFRAQQARAQADLALAKAELDLYKSLLDKQLVSKSLYDSRLASFRAAEASLQTTVFNSNNFFKL